MKTAIWFNGLLTAALVGLFVLITTFVWRHDIDGLIPAVALFSLFTILWSATFFTMVNES